MGQNEVFDFLREQRAKKPEKWFSVKEVKEALKNNIDNPSYHTLNKTTSHLYKLAHYGLIHAKGVGVWKHYKVFRGKL